MDKSKVTNAMKSSMRDVLKYHRNSGNITTYRRLRDRGLIVHSNNRMWLTAKGYQYANEQGWLTFWDDWAEAISDPEAANKKQMQKQLKRLLATLDEALGIVEKIPEQVPFRRIEDYLAASKAGVEIELGYTAPGVPPTE